MNNLVRLSIKDGVEDDVPEHSEINNIYTPALGKVINGFTETFVLLAGVETEQLRFSFVDKDEAFIVLHPK
jgi:hypothetical protein